MSFLFLEDHRTTYGEATKAVKHSTDSIQYIHTFVEDSVFCNTATVCSWADTSSMVFGRLSRLRVS